MAFNFAEKLRSLKGIAASPDKASDLAPDVAPDVAPGNVLDLAPDVAPDVGPVVATLPVRLRGTAYGKRTIAKLSARLSHAAILGLIAVVVSPLVTQRIQGQALKASPKIASKALAGPTVAQAQAFVAQPLVKPSPVVEPVRKQAPVNPVDIPVATLSPPAQLQPTRAALPAVAPTVIAAAVPEAARTVAITVTPDTPARAQIKLPKGKLKTVRARDGAPSVTLKSIRVAGPMLASVQSDTPLVVVIEPVPLRAQSVKLATLKTKTVSERKAKPAPAEAAASKPAQVAALDPKPDEANTAVAKIGVATRRDETTVIEAWAEDQIADGRKACQALLAGTDIVASDAAPIKEGACGAPAPVVVRRLASPKIDVQPPATMTCPMAASLNAWLTKSVQPAAIENFGVPVVRLLSASSYSCRNRYGQSNTQLSEHALVNALDLSGFVLADGRTVRVVESWGPVARDAKPEPVKVADSSGSTSKMRDQEKSQVMRLGARVPSDPVLKPGETSPSGANAAAVKSPDAKAIDKASRMAFLKRVHREACETFGTVLGPEANDAHRNHFHLDMMARRRTAYCQ